MTTSNWSPPVSGPAPVLQGYRTETRLLTARRVPVVAALFVVVFGVAHLILLQYAPWRGRGLLFLSVAYLVIYFLQIMIVRRRPELSVGSVGFAINAQALCMATYYGVMHADTDLLVLGLALLAVGPAILYPLGIRGQLLASPGPLVGFPLAIFIGANAGARIEYEILAIVTILLVSGVAAFFLDAQRFATYQEQAFSTALLEVGRVLNAAVSDPRKLAEQLTEYTRSALAADFAFLYQRDSDTPVFHVTACSHVPSNIEEEIHTVDFSLLFGREPYRLLEQFGCVELIEGQSEPWGVAPPLSRWNLPAIVLQAIKRNQETIAILVCCYTKRHDRIDPTQRRLLTGVANQAVVALENARAMAEAHRSNQVKSEFVATISHELRTPLNVILGYTGILLDGVGTSSLGELEDMLHRIQQESMRLLDLVRAMLDLNRLETRRLPVSIAAFSLGELIADVRGTLSESWCKSGVALRWNVRGSEVELRTDRAKAGMILRNLIHNALKYTDLGSVAITVTPLIGERRVVFAVADTGPGIAPGDHAAIFEMFQQGSSGNPPREGGVGLGLYIVKRFTESLGGTVTVDSQIGDGSRFTVSLPMAAPQAATA